MKVRIDVGNKASAHLTFEDHQYVIRYLNQDVEAISLSLQVRTEPYKFHTFPPQLESLLPKRWHSKLITNKNKLEVLIAIGRNVPGNLTFVKA